MQLCVPRGGNLSISFQSKRGQHRSKGVRFTLLANHPKEALTNVDEPRPLLTMGLGFMV